MPNRPTKFTNAGQVLPALKSTQTELGLKWQAQPRLLLTAALFNIDKPLPTTNPRPGILLRVAGGKTGATPRVGTVGGGHADQPMVDAGQLTALDAKYTAAVDPAWWAKR